MPWVQNPSTAYFHVIVISLEQAEITGEVLTGRFSSSTVVVHSASESRANRVAAYQW